MELEHEHRTLLVGDYVDAKFDMEEFIEVAMYGNGIVAYDKKNKNAKLQIKVDLESELVKEEKKENEEKKKLKEENEKLKEEIENLKKITCCEEEEPIIVRVK
jgi:hypothetical protein